jgi:hypothetical protein
LQCGSARLHLGKLFAGALGILLPGLERFEQPSTLVLKPGEFGSQLGAFAG